MKYHVILLLCVIGLVSCIPIPIRPCETFSQPSSDWEDATCFVFDDFSTAIPKMMLQKQGTDYRVVDKKLQLTYANLQRGQTWFIPKVYLRGFEIGIDFSIFGGNSATVHQHGWALVWQTFGIGAIGVPPDCGLGYGGRHEEAAGIPQSVAIEFDTFKNVGPPALDNLADPNPNHISIHGREGPPANANSADEKYHQKRWDSLPALYQNNTASHHSVKVVFEPTEHGEEGQVTVYFDDFPARLPHSS